MDQRDRSPLRGLVCSDLPPAGSQQPRSPNTALDDVAYGLLGVWPERVLALGIYAWFFGLLLLGTEGRTRLIGWAIVPIVTAYHLIGAAGDILAFSVPSLGVISLLLPFVWLLIEGAKRAAPDAVGPRPSETEHVKTTTA